jgi:hypothetical protein
MFPFVIQINEIVMERELKLRQALQAMGLHDIAYWLSWHFYQSIMAMLFGFFIWVFGMMFQFKMFHKNGWNAHIYLLVHMLNIRFNLNLSIVWFNFVWFKFKRLKGPGTPEV